MATGESGVGCVCGEDEVEALRVGGAAAEAVAGALVDGRVAVHRGWGVTGWVGRGMLRGLDVSTFAGLGSLS